MSALFEIPAICLLHMLRAQKKQILVIISITSMCVFPVLPSKYVGS